MFCVFHGWISLSMAFRIVSSLHFIKSDLLTSPQRLYDTYYFTFVVCICIYVDWRLRRKRVWGGWNRSESNAIESESY